VGQPAKFQTKEDVEKHVLGIYQRVYETSSEQEGANVQNDLSRPPGVPPGKYSNFMSVLPDGKTFSWGFTERLGLVTLFGLPDMNSYSIEKQSDGSWILEEMITGMSPSRFGVCDSGLIWAGQSETNLYVKISSKAFSTKAEVYNYHNVKLLQ